MKQFPELVPIERLLKVKDVAAILQMSVSWVYKEVEAGRLPCVRLGASVRFRAEDVRAFADGGSAPGNTGTTILAAGRAK